MLINLTLTPQLTAADLWIVSSRSRSSSSSRIDVCITAAAAAAIDGSMIEWITTPVIAWSKNNNAAFLCATSHLPAGDAEERTQGTSKTAKAGLQGFESQKGLVVQKSLKYCFLISHSDWRQSIFFFGGLSLPPPLPPPNNLHLAFFLQCFESFFSLNHSRQFFLSRERMSSQLRRSYI